MKESEFLERINNKEWTLDYKDALKYHAIDKIVSPKDLPEVTPYEISGLSKLFGL